MSVEARVCILVLVIMVVIAAYIAGVEHGKK